MSLITIIFVATVGVRISHATSPESLCSTATTCLGKTNLGITDALVAGLDPVTWNRVFGDVAQIAKQLKTVNWTLETNQTCNFLVRCGDLSHPDCVTFVGDRGGVCDWNDGSGMCQSNASQSWQTSKVVSTQIVGCQYFRFASACIGAVPVPLAGKCDWDNIMFRCQDVNSSNPGRVEKTCSEDFKVDNRTQYDIRDMIDRIQSVAQSYRTNSSGTGVSSSLDITQYIARQLESNWTMTAGACVSLTSALLGTNVSAFACDDDVPQCDNFAQWQVVMKAVHVLCEKVQNAHIVVV
jgi:hypothetical protein